MQDEIAKDFSIMQWKFGRSIKPDCYIKNSSLSFPEYDNKHPHNRVYRI